jgi:hypothetical protein
MNRLSGRSWTGVWVLESAGRLIGPFDGKYAATDARAQLGKVGVVATARRVFSLAEALEAAEVRAVVSAASREPELGSACTDDPDGLHHVGCGCEDSDFTPE